MANKENEQRITKEFESYLSLLQSPVLTPHNNSKQLPKPLAKQSIARLDDLVYHQSQQGLRRFLTLLELVSQQTSPSACLRLLCVIHSCLQANNYAPSMIRLMEQNLDLPDNFAPTENKVQQWLQQTVVGYHKHLLRLCANNSLYLKMRGPNRIRGSSAKLIPSESEQQQNIITDIFLVINQLNVFVHQAKQVFNCAGRYYQGKLQGLDTIFYDILKKEYLQLYEYLRQLVLGVLANFVKYSYQELICFLEGYKEIDRITDSMEELVKNKYYSTNNNISFVSMSTDEEYMIMERIHVQEMREYEEMSGGKILNGI